MTTIRQLSLQNFRSFKSQVFEFDSPLTLIVGPNASGKTSIVEAIYMLASGESFRATKVEEMVNFGADLARIEGEVNLEDEKQKLGLVLTRGVINGQRTKARHFLVNDLKKLKKNFVGQMLAVAFRPEDMRLIEGSKSRRRRYMDGPLSLIDWQYQRAVKTYDEALRKRNKLLQQIREGEMPESVLPYWNQQLLEHGQYLQQRRAEYLDSFEQVEFPLKFKVSYLKSLMSKDRLKQYARQEILAGHTLVGPHKDDFAVELTSWRQAKDSFAIATYGSRGQQRLAVLWLKICELEFLKQKTHQLPVLLLDDVLSELDEESRAYVIQLILGDSASQVIISTAEEKTVAELEQSLGQLQKIHLQS